MCVETAYVVEVAGFCAWAGHLCTNTGVLDRKLQRVHIHELTSSEPRTELHPDWVVEAETEPCGQPRDL